MPVRSGASSSGSSSNRFRGSRRMRIMSYSASKLCTRIRRAVFCLTSWKCWSYGEGPTKAKDAAREKLVQTVNSRQALLDVRTELHTRPEQSVPHVVQELQARLL